MIGKQRRWLIWARSLRVRYQRALGRFGSPVMLLARRPGLRCRHVRRDRWTLHSRRAAPRLSLTVYLAVSRKAAAPGHATYLRNFVHRGVHLPAAAPKVGRDLGRQRQDARIAGSLTSVNHERSGGDEARRRHEGNGRLRGEVGRTTGPQRTRPRVVFSATPQFRFGEWRRMVHSSGAPGAPGRVTSVVRPVRHSGSSVYVRRSGEAPHRTRRSGATRAEAPPGGPVPMIHKNAALAESAPGTATRDGTPAFATSLGPLLWSQHYSPPTPLNIENLTDEVMKQMDRRLIAWRERMGKI